MTFYEPYTFVLHEALSIYFYHQSYRHLVVDKNLEKYPQQILV